MVLLAALAVWIAGCASGGSATLTTGTRITPEHYRFAEIIAPTEGEPGGWRAVCIKARTGQRVAHPQAKNVESSLVCDFEVGMPIVTRQHGHIPPPTAQRIAADRANEAAYSVLHRARGLSAAVCERIRVQYNRLLGVAVGGSRVNRCGVTMWSRPVPVVHWPPWAAGP